MVPPTVNESVPPQMGGTESWGKSPCRWAFFVMEKVHAGEPFLNEKCLCRRAFFELKKFIPESLFWMKKVYAGEPFLNEKVYAGEPFLDESSPIVNESVSLPPSNGGDRVMGKKSMPESLFCNGKNSCRRAFFEWKKSMPERLFSEWKSSCLRAFFEWKKSMREILFGMEKVHAGESPSPIVNESLPPNWGTESLGEKVHAGSDTSPPPPIYIVKNLVIKLYV
jgi:hypothetical protein